MTMPCALSNFWRSTPISDSILQPGSSLRGPAFRPFSSFFKEMFFLQTAGTTPPACREVGQGRFVWCYRYGGGEREVPVDVALFILYTASGAGGSKDALSTLEECLT